MGFRINTNIAAMNAHRNSTQTNIGLDKSLQSLSSGLRINTAADDASGMAIANSLRSQAAGLGQAIRNANDGIGVAQTADGALEEYSQIINIVRTKAIQAASDGQNTDSRMAIQRDISKLLEEADNIAKTTQFNGQQLLNGDFVDKNFQIGAYANETVSISIDSTRTSVVGQYAELTGTAGTSIALSANDLSVNGIGIPAASAADATNNINDLAEGAESAYAAKNAINSMTANSGVVATAETTVEGALGIVGGVIDGASTATAVYINGVNLGNVTFSANDETGTLAAAINKITDQTGVSASIVSGGKLKLTSDEGYNIMITNDLLTAVAPTASTAQFLGAGSQASVNGDTIANLDETNVGAITLESDNAITIAGTAPANVGLTAGQTSVANSISTADVTTYDEAQKTIKKADHALAQLDRIRSGIGSSQNQLESTIRNISVTEVNVKAAESQIRDVDFAAESANFAKHNILAQSGSYAMSQANAVQQNVLKLLQ